MAKCRGAMLGKYIAKAINQFSSQEFFEAVQKPSYKEIIREVLSVPFETRKKEDKSPKQNKSELEEIPYDKFNIANPMHYAALLRERAHFNYNANTSNRVRESLLENL